MRRAVRGKVRVKYLNASGRWPSGNVRYYYRPPGCKGTPLPDAAPDAPAFLAAYVAAASGAAKATATDATGTIGAGIVAFKRSDRYLGWRASTRASWGLILTDIRLRYGSGTIATLTSRHIRQDLAPLAPHPANNRLKVWRALCKWWAEAGLADTDAARDVRPRETPSSDGHTPWSRADFAAFRAHWPVGTAQRLAFEVMYRTCAAIGDACALGPGNLRGEWLVYRRAKTGAEAVVPMTAAAPAWFEHDDHLQAALDARRGQHMLWLTTASGGPRSPKAAAQWFSTAARAAGLTGLTAHGIRKGRAAIFRENGATAAQRMAILAHETERQAAHYSKAADLTKIVMGTAISNHLPTAEKGAVKTKG